MTNCKRQIWEWCLLVVAIGVLLLLLTASVFGQATATPTVTNTLTPTTTPTLASSVGTSFGCYEGTGGSQYITTGFPVSAVFVAGKNTSTTHNIWYKNDHIAATTACEMVYTGIAMDCNVSWRLGALDATGFTVLTNLNQVGATYCYYAYQSSWGLMATGNYTGNGIATRDIDVGWQPDVVLLSRYSTLAGGVGTVFATTDTLAEPTPLVCGVGTGSVQCTYRQIYRFYTTGFSVLKNYGNLASNAYVWTAFKKNASVPDWLWTAHWHGAVETPVAVNVTEPAKMLMVSRSALGSDCAGVRHGNADLVGDPYLQRAGLPDEAEGITLSGTGFTASEDCSVGTGSYFAWGMNGALEVSVTPTVTQTPTITTTPTSTVTQTLTFTPTPTITPLPGAVCCDGGPSVNCVNSEDFGGVCPAWYTPKADCVCAPVE